MATVWANILDGFVEIFSAPFRDSSIWWVLTPIILFWLVLEVYFGMYKGEKLGWNTALGNGLNLFWVVVISLKALFTKNLELFSIDKLIAVIVIAVYSGFIISVSFTHKLKENIFFLFASPTTIYYLSGITILWIHGLINITLWVIIDLIIFYTVLMIFEIIMRKLISPASKDSGMEDAGIGDTGLGDAGMEGTGMGNIGKGFGKI
ncbi:MAG: hypothetical protein QF655_04155 [Candidatus Woesearchaeota archaeon]|nr:hypothetical protein [Candidatus Woesearchaeota archaeon]